MSLQEEKPQDNYVPETLEELPSFEDSPQAGSTTILESIQEEEGQDAEDSEMSISDKEEEDERDGDEGEVVEERDAMQKETEVWFYLFIAK